MGLLESILRLTRSTVASWHFFSCSFHKRHAIHDTKVYSLVIDFSFKVSFLSVPIWASASVLSLGARKFHNTVHNGLILAHGRREPGPPCVLQLYKARSVYRFFPYDCKTCTVSQSPGDCPTSLVCGPSRRFSFYLRSQTDLRWSQKRLQHNPIHKDGSFLKRTPFFCFVAITK